jgi:hypothetical protein
LSAVFDLSGLILRVRGLPESHRRRLEESWSAFLIRDSREPFLEIQVQAEGEVEDDGTSFSPKEMKSAFHGTTASYRMQEGSAEVPLQGIVRIRLEPTTSQRQYFTFINFVTAALAWRLPSRGGALLHAAAIVVGDRAFALVGPEASGKTTWARVAREAGERVLSDDIVVVEPGPGGRIETLATPFRSKTGPGRWPLAAVLLPEHGARPSLQEVSLLQRRARIGANLPFFAEAWTVDPRVERLVETLADAVPFRRLTFAIEPSFLDLLRSFEPGV